MLPHPEHLSGSGVGREGRAPPEQVDSLYLFTARLSARLNIWTQAGLGWNSVFYSEKSSLIQTEIVIIVMLRVFQEGEKLSAAGAEGMCVVESSLGTWVSDCTRPRTHVTRVSVG